MKLKLMNKQKHQDKLSIRNFKVGDIIMVREKLRTYVFNVIAFGRIRKINKDDLIVKLISIPNKIGRKYLMGYYTVTYSNINSMGVRKYWIINKLDAVILLKSNSNLAKFDYKSLVTYVKLKYTKYIQKGLLKI